MEVDISLPARVDSIAEARAALSRLRDELPEDQLEDARLLVSELVTNAIRHSGAGADDEVRLLAVVDDRCLHIEVHDPGHGFAPRDPGADPTRPGGWGLHLVRTLSSRWGICGAGRTRVWFEIDRETA